VVVDQAKGFFIEVRIEGNKRQREEYFL